MAQRRRNIELTQVTEWENGKAARVEDCLAAEEPLEMRAGRYSLGITLRTPGDDEDLVAGFLFTEGILSRREDLVALRMPDDTAPNRNLVRVTLDPSVRLSANNATRRFSAAGCSPQARLCRRWSIRFTISGSRAAKTPPPNDPSRPVCSHTGCLIAACRR